MGARRRLKHPNGLQQTDPAKMRFCAWEWAARRRGDYSCSPASFQQTIIRAYASANPHKAMAARDGGRDYPAPDHIPNCPMGDNAIGEIGSANRRAKTHACAWHIHHNGNRWVHGGIARPKSKIGARASFDRGATEKCRYALVGWGAAVSWAGS